MKIEQVKTSELKPYGRNNRKHPATQVEKLVKQIQAHGWDVPIVADKDLVIIKGHARLAAAKKLKLKTVPVIVRDDLTPEQCNAARLADNKLGELAEIDMEAIQAELDALKAVDFDLDLTAFDSWTPFAVEEEQGTEGLTDPDDVPEVKPDPKSKLGDIWLLGEHRVMCGDSTDAASVAILMNGQKADMVFTDPPYGVEYQSNMRTKSDKFDVIENDDKFLDIAPVIESVSKGWVFVWTSWKVQTKWIQMFEKFGYPTNIVIWHKPGGGIGDLKKTFSSDYEVALVWHRGAELCGNRIGSVWTINKDGASTYVHPTQKPVALAAEALDKTTKVGASVLDLFLGSGSTLIACEKTGRKCYGMELSPNYVDVIVKRWQDFTGKKAIREDGVEFDSL